MSGTAQCPRCGAENPPQSRYCNNCGSALEAGVSRREERKLVSILFVDLVGFTSSSDRADPEDVRDALQLYHARARECIEQHGGVLEKFIGDAVMAVFGAPVAHGDDAERAVRAGLRVLEALDELNREQSLDLAARAAVNTGEAVVAVGAQHTGEALAIGDVVNTASRLQSAAPPGRLIVGSETQRATRNAIRYETFAPVDAKGKAEPVEAWLAVEPALAPAERPIAATPLVGRQRELELLHSLWGRALSERRPHLVTVLGPPGIGKSRLCREVSAFVAIDGGRILRGRCLPYAEQTGYRAFSHFVRSACGILESDSPETVREKLQRTVDELVPAGEATDTGRYLALLLGLGGEDPVGQQRLLFFAARRFVECLALASPTLVVFEDIHWAQGSELELIEYLAKHVHEAPVLFVAPARPELLDRRATWGAGLVAHTTIALDPLAPADAASLAEQLVGAADGSVDVSRLVEVAEGNPLFLEELAASVVDTGEATELPVTVREAIASRIDAMPRDARAALLAAAVVGRTFWRGVVTAVGGVDDVDEALSTLELRDLVRRDPISELSGDVQFTFKHMLIREVAYATVSRATRRGYHAAVARYIEETIAGASETLAWVLAYHWREAGEAPRAVPYLLAAAEAARRGWAPVAVVDLYAQALELTDDDELRKRIRLDRGKALVELGQHVQAAGELGELLPELEGEQRLNALIARGHATLWGLESHDETIETGEEAVALAEALGDAVALPAALATLSQGHAMRGAEGDLDRALELGDRALEEWVPGERRYDLAYHLHLQADATYWTGYYERCIDLSRRARELARDVRSAEAVLRGGGTEALGLAGMGRHEEALAIWDELFTIARDLDRNPRGLLNYSALAFRELLDLDEARRRSEEAIELSAGETFTMPLSFAKSDLIFTALLAGDIDRAQAEWPDQWRAAADATGWTQWLIYGRLAAARAEIALHAETPKDACEWAQRAIEIAQRTRRRKYEARARSVLGQALARLGDRERALAELRAGVAIADELVGPPARWDARAALGRGADALGDDDAAATAHNEAGALVESFASTLAPERAARLLDAAAIRELVSLAR